MFKHTSSPSMIRLGLSAAALLLALGLTPVMAGGSGRCLVAELDEPFQLPDGSSHPAGLLRICVTRTHSPSAMLHTISTADGDRGFYLGHRSSAEQSSRETSPEFVFERRGSEALTLLAYRVPGDERAEIYWLTTPGARRPTVAYEERLEKGRFEFLAAVIGR